MFLTFDFYKNERINNVFTVSEMLEELSSSIVR